MHCILRILINSAKIEFFFPSQFLRGNTAKLKVEHFILDIIDQNTSKMKKRKMYGLDEDMKQFIESYQGKAIRDDTERDEMSDTEEWIVITFEDEFLREMADWIARVKSEMEREMKRMEMGDGLILVVERRMVFWMMMTSTRNTVMADDAVSITREGRLVTLLALF